MRTGALISLCCWILAACNNKDRIPAHILSRQKMQAVLWDLMRADQFLGDFVLNKDSSVNRDTSSIRIYRQVFALHGITKNEFRESFRFYNDHPALMKVIMDSISAKREIGRPALQVKPDSVVAVPVKPVTKPDSVVRPPDKKQLRVE